MKFIVFEGLDGAGKSSLMLALAAELQQRAIPFYQTREPGGTALGDQIRDLILKKQQAPPTAKTELLLYQASRAQHVELVIQPRLKNKEWVLCDRFSASSVAFQAGGRELSREQVDWLNEFSTGGLKADITVLLDLSVDESRRRRQGRGQDQGQSLSQSEDRIESEADAFHQKVRDGFLNQAKEDSKTWIVLDATHTPEELKIELFNALKQCGILT